MTDPEIPRRDAPRELRIDGLVAQPSVTARIDGALGPVLAATGPDPTADHATVYSRDGLFIASIPLDRLEAAELRDGRVHMDETPTRCWLVKDVTRIELTAGRQPDSLPAEERAKT